MPPGLIMIWMAVYFFIYKKKKAFTLPVLVAFFFSWTGDNFLMFSGKDELYFYAGVGGFFLAQITYIYIFSTFREKPEKGLLQKKPALILFFLAVVVKRFGKRVGYAFLAAYIGYIYLLVA